MYCLGGSNRVRSSGLRKGIERRQLERAFLEWLYHRTVAELSSDTSELLQCSLGVQKFKPSVQEVVREHLKNFINLYHDRWYRDHKKASSNIPGICFIPKCY